MLLLCHGEEEKRMRLESGVACGSGWAGGCVVWGKGRMCGSGDSFQGDALVLIGIARVGSTARWCSRQGGQIPCCIGAIVLISE